MRNYTDEDIILNAAKVSSMRQLLLNLGLKNAGGSYANMKRHLQRLKINCDHWKGSAWNKDCQLKDWSKLNSKDSVRKRVFKTREHKCEREGCGKSEWFGKKAVLEIHHIDGNNCNNDETNLQLLCLDCHSQSPGWRGRK